MENYYERQQCLSVVGEWCHQASSERLSAAFCHMSVEGASIKECQNFFNGDDFRMMTKLDGPTLMHQLEEEARKYKYNWAALKKAHGEE